VNIRLLFRTQEAKDMARKSDRRLYLCSFCGKNQDQVMRLIAGPNGVFICDTCVRLCDEILAEDPRYAPNSQDEPTWRTETHDREADLSAQRTARGDRASCD
jgi:hypothetical protein